MSVTRLRPETTPPVWLTKRQLSEHPSIRRSTRWLEMQMRAGLPSVLEGHGRLFCLPDALAWISERHPGLAEENARLIAQGVAGGEGESDPEKRNEGGSPPEPAGESRIAALEDRVTQLEQRLGELGGADPAPAA